MNRNLERIAIVAARECVRQQVDLHALTNLLGAYEYALRHADATPTEADVRELGFLVEPEQNRGGEYRRLPVTLPNHVVIKTPGPHTVGRMMHMIAGADPSEVTNRLLDIHPFLDGNGRVAWVILNWLSGTLDDPVSLPDFYDEVAS